MKINININEIILEGFYNKNKNIINERRIVLAIEEELTRIFKEKDSMDLYKLKSKVKQNPEKSEAFSNSKDVKAFIDKKTNNEISLIDAGSVDISRNTNHDKIGMQIARSIYHSWHDNNIGNSNTKNRTIYNNKKL